ncbi:ABC transporter permease [Mucisphaera calidilacus]|uniref:Oligopeptide transport system permease protein OppC n=1 Tax=Mucisphaera calidilacus TaxID=2527982 RepID=A0A518BVL5_9BACT|nr:ABC transporter permease [Mucisphaera calidilacus]QDU71001.1 Oligopeptide transport system permease protein OppC [Mucisphaera calidilacus]
MSAIPAEPVPTRPASRGLIAEALSETWRRLGARLGLAWIGLIALLGVFAPLLASSHPLLIHEDGALRSPWIEHLSTTDLTLMSTVTVGVILFFVGGSILWRWVALLGIAVMIATLGSLYLDPPETVVYERYRVAEAEGSVDVILRTPIVYSPNDRLRDRDDRDTAAPWWAPPNTYNHWLGQDRLQQDMASRMIHASRIAIAIGFISTGLAAVIGILLGAPMGYFGKTIDLVGMRLVEIFEFIPQLYLLLIFSAFFPGDQPEILPGIQIHRIYLIMGIIGLTSWTSYARFVRAEFLKLRNQDFVLAARAAGLPLHSILFKHILPNGLTPVIVSASFGVASAILAEATLSFLGLGLIEEPSWGQLLNQAQSSGSFLWWIALFPGGAIFLTVFAYNLIGEALRDAIDPRTVR